MKGLHRRCVQSNDKTNHNRSEKSPFSFFQLYCFSIFFLVNVDVVSKSHQTILAEDFNSSIRQIGIPCTELRVKGWSFKRIKISIPISILTCSLRNATIVLGHDAMGWQVPMWEFPKTPWKVVCTTRSCLMLQKVTLNASPRHRTPKCSVVPFVI